MFNINESFLHDENDEPKLNLVSLGTPIFGSDKSLAGNVPLFQFPFGHHKPVEPVGAPWENCNSSWVYEVYSYIATILITWILEPSGVEWMMFGVPKNTIL